MFLSPEASGVRDVSPDMLPVEQQYTLLKAVTEGAGLVLIGTADDRVLKDRNKLKEWSNSIRLVSGRSIRDGTLYRPIDLIPFLFRV